MYALILHSTIYSSKPLTFLVAITKTRINSDKYNTRDLKTKTHKQYDLWVFPFKPKAVN